MKNYNNLYKPSNEQKNIIELLKNNNVIVESTAGSGKTTTSIHIAKEFHDKEILLLTYNSKLKDETRDKIKKLNLNNIEIHSFHSYAVDIKKYASIDYTDNGIINILKNKIKIKNYTNYDYIIIDEAQDINEIYFEFINKIIKDNIKKPILCIFGDRNQSIYSFNGADYRFMDFSNKFFKNLNSYEWKRCKLNETFRMSIETVNFINNCCFKKEIIISNKISKNLPKYHIIDVYDTKYIYKNIIKKLLKKYKVDDIFIISPSIKNENSPIRCLANYLSSKKIDIYIPDNDDDKPNKKIMKKKLVFTTFHQVKGLERKVIIIFGFDESYFRYYKKNYDPKILPNELYVALTRSSEKLFILHSYKENFLPFLDISKLEKYCNIYNNKDMLINKENINFNYNDNIGVVDLVKYLNPKINTYIKNKYEKKEIKTEEVKLKKINNSIKQKNNKWEQVSDINGIAIPIFYEYKCRNEKINKISSLIHLNNLVKNNISINLEYKFIFKYKKFIEKLFKQKTKLEINDLLFLANLWNSFLKKVNFKLNQIDLDKYNWLNKEDLKCIDKIISNYVNNNSEFEVKLENKDFKEIYNKKIIGYIDCIDFKNKTIWEFKFCSKIKDEHFYQIIIYNYLFKKQQQKILSLSNKINNFNYIKENEIINIKYNNKIINVKFIKLDNNNLICKNLETNENIIIHNKYFRKNKTLEKIINKWEGNFKIKLFNIYTNKIYEINLNINNNYQIIDKLLFYKFKNKIILNDLEFENKTIKYCLFN